MTNPAKLTKLLQRLQWLITFLDNQPDLVIHRHVNQFYHMQKSEELKILRQQFEETQQQMETIGLRMDMLYQESFVHWRRDIRWLNNHLAREVTNDT